MGLEVDLATRDRVDKEDLKADKAEEEVIKIEGGKIILETTITKTMVVIGHSANTTIMVAEMIHLQTDVDLTAITMTKIIGSERTIDTVMMKIMAMVRI